LLTNLGLGALLVRNDSSWVLEKTYFGGGTVNIALPSQPFHVKRASLEERWVIFSKCYKNDVKMRFTKKILSVWKSLLLSKLPSPV